MFAPVYRQSRASASHRVDGERKRRRLSEEQNDESNASEASASSSPLFRPIDRNDPYLVAGYSREKELPPYPFPHAAVISSKSKPSQIAEELLDLKPAVHELKTQPDTRLTKRQHIDNLTALLHLSVNKNDWGRASRIMGLLLRSDFNGTVDLRRHERWAIAAEILMRRQQAIDEGEQSSDNDLGGFKTARQYYERLALQYPHTARTKDTFSAATVYPSLFNIWIYEVQQRSKLAREAAESRPSTSSSSTSFHNNDATAIRLKEVEEAEPIAVRLDEMLRSPPYDTDPAVLRLRAMVALWLSDLYAMDLSAASMSHLEERFQQSSRDEKTRAKEHFAKLAELNE